MSIYDKLDKGIGGYIFLSHSHADIEKVRIIRNDLENNGFEPLCFYLKCLSDDSEIEELIKREIDAREWFVFVNSENARKSRWVTLEREYITKTNHKKIIAIDINDANAANKITHTLRTFFAYSRKDYDIARRIQRRLGEKDYLVYDLEKIDSGTEWAEAVAVMLSEVVDQGIMIALITSDFLKSQWTNRELQYVIAKGGYVIPIILGNTPLPLGLQLQLGQYQQYHLPENPTNDELDRMIDQIGKDLAAKE